MTHTQRYIILTGIIAVLIGLNYIALKGWYSERIESTRKDNNYAAARQAASNRVIQEQLTRKQFERFYEAKIDSLRQLGLKRIDGITSVKIKKVFQDRLVWRDSIITIHDTVPIPVKLIATSDSCLNLTVTDMGDSALVEAICDPDIEIVLLRGQRSKEFKVLPFKVFKKYLVIRHGKRIPIVHALSNCGVPKVTSVLVVD
jgi:hypothetical protein